MKINAIDIKPGNVLEYQNKLWLVLKRELVQPGKGGAFAQVELRDLRGGTKLNERFRTQETVERVRLDEKEMQFLFMENGQATFMDNDTFEQIPIPRETIGDRVVLLQAGQARERAPGDDPAAYRPGHAHRRQHCRRKLRRASQGLRNTAG